MAINKITGFNIFAAEPIDSRQVAYATTAAAIAAIPEVFRYVGLTIPIFESGSLGDEIIEYWWEKGVADGDLVIKLPVIDDLPISTFNNDVGYFDDASFNSSNGNLTLIPGNDSPALPNVVVNFDGRWIDLSEKATANGVATLDGSGLIPTSQIPPLAITEYLGNFTDTTAALADAGVQASQRGDWFTVDTNGGESWIVISDNPTVIGDIQKLSTPTDAVLSVNGQTGVVSLDASDIGFTPYLTITSTDVQAAIQELKDELDNFSSVSFGAFFEVPYTNATNDNFLYSSLFRYEPANGIQSQGSALGGVFRKSAGSGGDIARFATESLTLGHVYGTESSNFGLNSFTGLNLTFRTGNTERLNINASTGVSDFQGNQIIAGRATIDNVDIDGNGYIVTKTANDRYFLTNNLFGNNGYRIGYLYDDANTSAGYLEFDRITDTDEYVRMLFLFTRPNLTTWSPIAINSNDESILFNGIDINITGDSPFNVDYGPLDGGAPNWDNTFQMFSSIGFNNRVTSLQQWDWYWPEYSPALGWVKGFRMGTITSNDSSSNTLSNSMFLFFDFDLNVGDIPGPSNILYFGPSNAVDSYLAADGLQLHFVKDDINPTFNNGIPLADGDGIINGALVGSQGDGSYIAYNGGTQSWEVLGKDFKQIITSDAILNVSGTTPIPKINQNVNLPRAGNYIFWISYGWSCDSGTNDAVVILTVGGNNVTALAGGEIHRQEPKDTAGNDGDGRGTNQKHMYGAHPYYLTGLAAGNINVTLTLNGGGAGVLASMWDVVIIVEEIR